MAIATPIPYSTGTRRPRLQAPPNACDCHMHIFDGRFPLVPHAPPVPDASPADYRLFQARIGTSRAVIVAPSMYGLDNRCTLEATQALGAGGRCVVTLGPDTPIDEIRAMHAGGARGFRFNLARSALNSLDTLLPIAQRVAPLGWHVQLWMHPDTLLEIAPVLARLPIPVVLDHMAGLPLHGGSQHAAYPAMLALLEQGRAWMKLSLATACRQLGTPAQADLDALAREIVAIAPDRVLWGSDWPHVMASLEQTGYPDDAALLDTLLDWTDDVSVHKQILVENPAQLYQFED